MAAKRQVKCRDTECGRVWDSTAKPENLKCKDCKGTDIEDNYVDPDAPDTKPKEPEVCKRCGGDGIWHSTKTGYRAKTSADPLTDPNKPCPECSGK